MCVYVGICLYGHVCMCHCVFLSLCVYVCVDGCMLVWLRISHSHSDLMISGCNIVRIIWSSFTFLFWYQFWEVPERPRSWFPCFASDYPCPLVSMRFREPVYREVGHTIMNLLVDLRNFQYRLPRVDGLVVHMEDKKTFINLPRCRYKDVSFASTLLIPFYVCKCKKQRLSVATVYRLHSAGFL